MIVNNLLARYDWERTNDRADFDKVIVSSYAMKLITKTLVPDEYIDVAKKLLLNPSMDGYLFEDWVIASLRENAILCAFQRRTFSWTSAPCTTLTLIRMFLFKHGIINVNQ